MCYTKPTPSLALVFASFELNIKEVNLEVMEILGICWAVRMGPMLNLQKLSG